MPIKIDLAGEWKLESDSISIPVTVPGDTHSALLESGIISNPYWGDDELKIQGFGSRDWSFSREFDVSPDALNYSSVCLNIDSIDTVSDVFINGHLVGMTRNAFLRYRFEVGRYLQAGTNTIRILIKSPEIAALEENGKLPYPAPHNISHVQSLYRNLIRKPQCHAGWDWGLCMMVSGIYGSIYLLGTNEARIESVRCIQDHTDGDVDLTVLCEVHSTGGDPQATLWVEIGDHRTWLPINLQPGLNELSHTIKISSPDLWWPNGYGGQRLYDLTIEIGGAIDRRRIGFRTVEIVHRDDAHGHSLEFVVNGVPIFCKGASWIPADGFPKRQTRDVLSDLLDSAASANMNMIRVWGGGQYESNDFYDLCDERGLLVWQDFMFACSIYPATPEFLGLVDLEAGYQIRRLQHHACLALWCGNNENVGALNWFPESKANRDRYIVDYDRLNEGVLGKAVRELDPERLFWPSSPCGGPGDYSDCWHDDRRGDMHYWSVWFEDKPLEAVLEVRPRFCSEFGFQSFPSVELIRAYASDDQMNVTSPVMEHHQRSDCGNTRIVETLARYFRMPDGFENFVYLSQVQQAFAIKISVEHFRRIRPICMGAIYWQLNDLWPVCSWSSLEYGGKWKLLHYSAKRFFAPLMASILQTPDGDLEVWVNQDGFRHPGGKASLRVLRFSGEEVKRYEWATDLPQNAASKLASYRLHDLTDDVSSTFLLVEISAGEDIARNEHLFREFKRCTLACAVISIAVRQTGDHFAMNLSCDRPAFWVTLNVSGIRGEFSDNGFLLLPDQPREIAFYPKGAVGLDTIESRLTCTHLRESYN